MRMRKQLFEEELEFQIAPMVDVLLCLLIFFIMTTSAGVLRADKNLNLPVAPQGTKKDSARSEAIINVRWAPETKRGSFTMENVGYEDPKKIVPVLVPRVKADPGYRVVIRADRDCPARYIGKVMAACAEAGVDQISFAVLNRD